jgi:hypothetical protein
MLEFRRARILWALLMEGRRFVRADLIITHGSVRTMEPGAPRAEAIAIAGDKIMEHR